MHTPPPPPPPAPTQSVPPACSLQRAPHFSHRLRQVDSCHVVLVERPRLVVARPRQPRLRIRPFQPVGHTRLIPPPRLRQFVVRQLQPVLRHLHLLLRRLQSIE